MAIKIYLQLNAQDEIEAITETEGIPGPGGVLPANMVDVTSEPVPDGKEFWWQIVGGYKYNRVSKVTTPPPLTPPTVRDGLRGKPSSQWSNTDIADWLKNQ